MDGESQVDLDLWRHAVALRMDALEKKVDDNTAVTNRVDANTSELVDILKSWQGAMKVFDFLGRLAKPIGAILVFLASMWAAWPAKK